MISRRAVALGLLTVGAIGGRAPAQTASAAGVKSPSRLGLLLGVYKNAFIEGLRDAGYVEGANVVLEFRPFSPPESLSRSIGELIALNVDVIVASGSQAVRAAQTATRTIPIVMTGSSDPVGTGLVASLARPGGNITGLSLLNPELSGKRLELLQEIAGDIPRIAVLLNPDDPPAVVALKETEDAARVLGIEPLPFAVRRDDDFVAAFASAIEAHTKAVVILSAPLMSMNTRKIAEWALQNQLPAVYWERDFPHVGGLMSYGPDLADQYRRAAAFVDKILKGAKPADLPVEQPTKFQLVVNLKTAKALDLNVPQSILARADEVIE